jgi:glucose-1-phosphate thymidylyltransferase
MSAHLDKAVLLAAGRGRRLAPYTDDRPKPLIPLCGRPVLELVLRHLRHAGYSQVLLVVGHLDAQIRACFGDGTALGLRVSYVRQEGLQGTGAAAVLAESFAGGDPFFLGWGDVLAAGAEYRRLAEAFRAEPADGLLLLERVADPHAGAAVYVDGDRITRLVEKPPEGSATTPWNQAGLAVYTPSIFPLLRRVPLSPRGELEFTAAVQELVASGARVRGLPMASPRLHLTDPADLQRVEKVLRADGRYWPDGLAQPLPTQ